MNPATGVLDQRLSTKELLEIGRGKMPQRLRNEPKPPTQEVTFGSELPSAALVGQVRRHLLVDVPLNCVELQQRIGRSVRFNGHATLPEAERVVEVKVRGAMTTRLFTHVHAAGRAVFEH